MRSVIGCRIWIDVRCQRDRCCIRCTAWIGDRVIERRLASEARVGWRVSERAIGVHHQLADFRGRIVRVEDIHWCGRVDRNTVDFGDCQCVAIRIRIVTDHGAGQWRVVERRELIISRDRRRVIERRWIGWINRSIQVTDFDRNIRLGRVAGFVFDRVSELGFASESGFRREGVIASRRVSDFDRTGQNIRSRRGGIFDVDINRPRANCGGNRRTGCIQSRDLGNCQIIFVRIAIVGQ